VIEWVIITGASSGIGEALAYEYAGLGYNLVLIARRLDKLEHVASSCRSQGVKVSVLRADVTDPNFEVLLKSQIKADMKIAVAIANAGAGAAGRIEKLSFADYERNLQTNVMGVIRTVQAVLPHLESSCGRLVIMGSLNSYLALPLGSPYNMGKFAVRALAEGLSIELAPKNISVSLICPGPVKSEILQKNNAGVLISTSTDQMGTRHFLSAEKAAARIAKGVRRKKREVFLTWDSRLLVALHRHMPGITIAIIKFVFLRYRKKFEAMVGVVNPDAVGD
jgi:short-subunit dehydrogenase